MTQINWQHDTSANRLHTALTHHFKERGASVEWKFIFIEIKYLMLEWAFKIIMAQVLWNLVCNKMLFCSLMSCHEIFKAIHTSTWYSHYTHDSAIAAGCFNINRKWVVIEIILPITHSINICVKVQSGNVCTSVGRVRGEKWQK